MIVLVAAIVWSSLCQGAAPFVPGFERFARHSEIDLVTAGRLLLTELSCTACHEASPLESKPKGGPDLSGVGNRLQRAWMAEFLASPQTIKPGTTMPNLLHGLSAEEKAESVRAIVAFLSTLRQPFPEIKGTGANPVPNEFWNHGDAQQGRVLYHRIGCVACHEPDPDYETVETKPTPLDELLKTLEAEELEELGLAAAARRVESVPLGNLVRKYSRESLTHFLLDPHRARPAGRMPNFELGVVDAADIAASLLRGRSVSPLGTVQDEAGQDTELIAEGRRLFQESGCANCHSAGDVKKNVPVIPFAAADSLTSRSCIGVARPDIPHYPLDDGQMMAVTAAMESLAARRSSHSLTPAQKLQQTMLSLNCFGCHARDKQGGVGRYRKAFFETFGNIDIGDEGRLPPPLTGVGRKLKTASLGQVLQGKGSVRPHMKIRMPTFPTRQAKTISDLLVETDQTSRPLSENEVFGTAGSLAEAGWQLLDVGCVQCHSLKGEALPGVVGVDLEGITSRVQPQWFKEFLFNPGALKPRTRMPTFFPGGQSQNQQVLGGSTDKQIAAMWFYLKDLSRQPLPAKIEKARSQSYELIPEDRPIVLRTFMEQAGTHAIAVGFPQKVHFAFDAEQVRPAFAWRGRFLDAQGTWFVRFAPPAQPLGEDQLQLPHGVPLAILDSSLESRWPAPGDKGQPDATPYRFLGYQLDQTGVPTFLYRYDRFEIEDRVEPDDDHSLIRRLSVTDRDPKMKPVSLWLRGHVGNTLKYNRLLNYTSDTGLEVSVSGVDHAGELRQQESSGTEWLIPIKVDGKKVIEVRYRW